MASAASLRLRRIWFCCQPACAYFAPSNVSTMEILRMMIIIIMVPIITIIHIAPLFVEYWLAPPANEGDTSNRLDQIGVTEICQGQQRGRDDTALGDIVP